MLDQAINAGGVSEEDYWNARAQTTADQYADTFGGEAEEVAGRYRGGKNSVRPAFSDARFEYGDPRFAETRKLSDEQVWQQKVDMAMHARDAAGDTLVRWKEGLAQGAKGLASYLGLEVDRGGDNASASNANSVLNRDQLQAIFPRSKASDLDRYLPALNTYLPQYDMTTPERVAAFLGQIGVESNGFASTTESLYYKTPGLLHRNWPRLFPTPDSETAYLRNPEGLANYVYANKGGNGPVESGDGWNFRGSGLLQLTFKNTYRDIGNELGVDLVRNPSLVRNDPDIGVRASLQYWKDNGLNQYADKGDYLRLTKRINTSALHYDARLAITQQALQVLRQQQGGTR